MKNNTKIQHDSPHPGELLYENLKALNITVTEAAKKLFISRTNLSAILNKRSGISPVMALKLAVAFGTTAIYWTNLQIAFELSRVNDPTIYKIKRFTK